jgi:autotransporter family porin
LARQLSVLSLGTFHDRQGDQSLLVANGDFSAAWGRTFGGSTSQQWTGAANPSFDGTFSGVQSGLDLIGRESDAGHRDRIGLLASYGQASGSVNGFSGGFQDVRVGSLAIDATSLGGYWTHVGPGGWYVDGVAKHRGYTGSPVSSQGLSAETNGTGVIASLEAGLPIAIGAHLAIEPQAQLIYQHLALAPTRDIISTVDYGRSDAWSGRIGARVVGNVATASALLQPYLKVNVWRNFDGSDSVAFAATDVNRRRVSTPIGTLSY